MTRWYSVRIPTDIAATNTFDHYHTPVPRPPTQKRMDKLGEAGIRCKLTDYNGGYIEFPGYTP